MENENAQAGVVARYRGEKTFYQLRYTPVAGGRLELYKRDGVFRLLDSVPVGIEPGKWYDLKLEIRGSRLRGYSDGVLKIEVLDHTIASGKAGLRARTYLGRGTGNPATFDASKRPVAEFDDILISSP